MKFVKKLLWMIITIVILVMIVFGYLGYKMYNDSLEEMTLSERVKNVKEGKNFTKLTDLPNMYKNAVVSVEDHRFYNHGALDYIAIIRAIYTDIRTHSLKEGGSTITQQLAKNLCLSQESTPQRKIAEIIMAYKIEKEYSKDEILELYVNTCYFGDGYYNIREASKGYFNKEPKDMSDYECTLIAGIPNAPSIYVPTKNPDLAKKRQEKVLMTMVENEYITQEESTEILNEK